jgi:hypothetical protein
VSKKSVLTTVIFNQVLIEIDIKFWITWVEKKMQKLIDESSKDLFIKNWTRTVVTLLLFWFEFLWISLYFIRSNALVLQCDLLVEVTFFNMKVTLFDCEHLLLKGPRSCLFVVVVPDHSMARANLNKSVWLVINTTTASKYIP